jgi:hypothetical protein
LQRAHRSYVQIVPLAVNERKKLELQLGAGIRYYGYRIICQLVAMQQLEPDLLTQTSQWTGPVIES